MNEHVIRIEFTEWYDRCYTYDGVSIREELYSMDGYNTGEDYVCDCGMKFRELGEAKDHLIAGYEGDF